MKNDNENKNQLNQSKNEPVEKNYNKNASQSESKKVEPKHGKTEGSKDLNHSEANRESSSCGSKR